MIKFQYFVQVQLLKIENKLIQMKLLTTPFAFLVLFLLPLMSHADVEHKLFRKVAVFPIADTNFSSAEDAWWQMREMLTKDKKLFVAAKRFMINRGVFQPRRALKPADVIILGRLLDAEALVVTYLDDRTLKMRVYEGENGYLLWESDSQFHPAVSIGDQLIKVSSKMATDFLDSIPYQGFTEKDELHGKVIFEKEGKKYAKVFSGGRGRVEKGDPVQWVIVTGDPAHPVFNQSKEKVIAEGVIDSIDGEHLIVEVKQASDIDQISEDSLVRLPSEISKLKDLYAKENAEDRWSGEYFKDDLKPISDFQKEQHPAATGISFFFNVLAFVLLAF